MIQHSTYPVFISVVIPAPFSPRSWTDMFGLDCSRDQQAVAKSRFAITRIYHQIETRFKGIRSSHEVNQRLHVMRYYKRVFYWLCQ